MRECRNEWWSHWSNVDSASSAQDSVAEGKVRARAGFPAAPAAALGGTHRLRWPPPPQSRLGVEVAETAVPPVPTLLGRSWRLAQAPRGARGSAAVWVPRPGAVLVGASWGRPAHLGAGSAPCLQGLGAPRPPLCLPVFLTPGLSSLPGPPDGSLAPSEPGVPLFRGSPSPASVSRLASCRLWQPLRA